MMITFNDNEKKLKDDLNRDIALPAVVHERINTAYRMIEEHTVIQILIAGNCTEDEISCLIFQIDAGIH